MKSLLHNGDCLEGLKGLPDCSVDAVVTDPPAGIAFMGKDWDKDKGGRKEWIGWLEPIMRECLRVLKPGGHALVWALPRTSHWTATALEDAGFEVRDCIVHLFGSGFPKSAAIDKMIDKAVGNIDAARQWEGWGSALKPASEHWWLCRKPLIGTLAKNVLEWGVGGINIAATRVGVLSNDDIHAKNPHTIGGFGHAGASIYGNSTGAPAYDPAKGRWPPNTIFLHAPECREVGTKRVRGSAPASGPTLTGPSTSSSRGKFNGVEGTPSYADPDGMETVAAWDCVEGCPVAELDAQSGMSKSQPRPPTGKDDTGVPGFVMRRVDNTMRGHADTGGASRFFPTFRYQAKAPPKERKVEGVSARHPTVKPVALMQWLVRLVTPPNGTVLDPFTGSGTTGVAAILEGFRFVGFEKENEYFAIAKARIENAEKEKGEAIPPPSL